MTQLTIRFTLDELFDRCVVTDNGCWIWTGSDSGTGRGGGYGKVRRKGVNYYVHREARGAYKGKVIPKNFQVDHLCARWFQTADPRIARRCCNPEHLDDVPGPENQRRKHASF